LFLTTLELGSKAEASLKFASASAKCPLWSSAMPALLAIRNLESDAWATLASARKKAANRMLFFFKAISMVVISATMLRPGGVLGLSLWEVGLSKSVA
jgi:hypothetical protein